MTNHFNALIESEQERLAVLIEECGEVVQAACKILRHGYESRNPKIANSETNREALEREMGDLLGTIDMLLGVDVEKEVVETHRVLRTHKMHLYLHHQKSSAASFSTANSSTGIDSGSAEDEARDRLALIGFAEVERWLNASNAEAAASALQAQGHMLGQEAKMIDLSVDSGKTELVSRVYSKISRLLFDEAERRLNSPNVASGTIPRKAQEWQQALESLRTWNNSIMLSEFRDPKTERITKQCCEAVMGIVIPALEGK